MRYRLLSGALTLLLIQPALVEACATCMPTDGPTIVAYRWSTFGLSLFPLLVMGGGAYWLYRVITRYQDDALAAFDPANENH